MSNAMQGHSPARTNSLSAEQATEVVKTAAWLRQVLPVGADLHSDSRSVRPDEGYLAYPFDPTASVAQTDGRAYMQAAANQGARAVVMDESAVYGAGQWTAPTGVEMRQVAQLNELAGHIASQYYHTPSLTLRTIGITGTNGKTSSAQWIAQMLGRLGLPCAMMGTLGVGFPDDLVETGFTTPQAVEVHQHLSRMVAKGAKAMVMEVSSHALVQGRVNGVAFEVALFTNLSRDHLDYHGDMPSYQAAKARLFGWNTLKVAVINTDDAVGLEFAHWAMRCGIEVIAYGMNPPPLAVFTYLQASEIDQSGTQTRFVLNVHQQAYGISSPLVGAFNVMNLLGVLGVGMALGYDITELITQCAGLTAAAGRMQRLGAEGEPLAVIDFAHTPDALEKTLEALKPIAAQRGGRLVCVFGCGGDRDAGKRPQMGAIAYALADEVVVTSDNPRTEAPEAIIQAILAGLPVDHTATVVVDRAQAIATTLQRAAAADVILVAGKGHEPYQDIKGVKYPYSDSEQVQRALAQRTLTARSHHQDPSQLNTVAHTERQELVSSAVQTKQSVDAPATINPISPTRMSVLQIAGWTNALASQGQADITEICTDTRALHPQGLFVALKGERFDAHDFLPQLQSGQVAAVLAERVPEGFALPYVQVENTRLALQELAHQWRLAHQLSLAVVTGSNGKTTVKEMIASILNVAYGGRYIATHGNLNNDIGLPLTLLRIKAEHQAAVIELGMNHPGETAELAPLAAAQIALINNAQREHQEFMHTVEAVAQEHSAVIDSLQMGSGVVVFPAHDEHAELWRQKAHKQGVAIHDFSIDERIPAMYSARYELGLYASTVQLISPVGQCTTQINISGVHNVHNALAACAVTSAMGVSLDVIAKGLAAFEPVKGRLQTHRLNERVMLIDDTYNANPDSVIAAIDVLAAGAGKKILVLGDMGEVGADGEQYHAEVGAYANQRGIDILLATGELMRSGATAFGSGAQYFEQADAIADVVRAHLASMSQETVTVLIKGSRFMQMDRLVQALLTEVQAQMQEKN